MQNKVYFTLQQLTCGRKNENSTVNYPLLAVVSCPGIRLKCRLGFDISPSDWMGDVGQVQPFFVTDNGVNADEVNTVISQVRQTLSDYFNYCESIRTNPQKAEIVKRIYRVTGRKPRASKKAEKAKIKSIEARSFTDYINEYIRFKNLSEGRKKHYRCTVGHFLRFCNEERVKDPLNDLNLTHLERFRACLLTDKSKNTAHGILSRLKAFYGYANKMGYTTNNPFLRFEIEPEVYGNPIYITKEERDTLYYLHIPDERLKKTRDIFVFQCLIGCRVGDLIRLKKDNVVNGAIEYIPRKTKDERPVIARVPLCPKAQSIIDRYTIPEDEKLLPFISPQKYNDYIKELFRFANITRTVTRLNPLTRQEERVSIADIASSHMARRTFIGILHRKVKNEVIGSMSGHSANSKAFSRYYHIEDDTKRDAVNTYLD